ncbi:PD-(D/E)XK nuclease-like domain-containing protein [Enterococcus nangangensis]|uniref:PD-(D/E)XK nuclease-like domain-containing protein n=1 Tax=Enterococcus nangangensis TaxID=2559926 RepID=UPI0010F594DC|nr:PD-(D/E)XK nuclease-like domain-containing protein [Enterococcus nangangensis]
MTKKTFLSSENYYGNEANWQYMSVSQYKRFLECPALAIAELNGWESKADKTALYVGNYVHSFFESSEVHEKFKEDNKDIMFSSRKPFGLLKAYQVAEDMIQALNHQQAFKTLYKGEKEHIVQGELFGADWKGKIDCLNVKEGYFVDIKTHAGDFKKKVWNDRYGMRVSWIADYGYYLQMAVYRELLRMEFNKDFTPIIAAVSKQSPPAFKLYELREDMMAFELEELERSLPSILQMKYGQEEPKHCGSCEYCRETMQVTEFSDTEE